MPRVRTKSGKVKKYPYTKAGMKKAKAAKRRMKKKKWNKEHLFAYKKKLCQTNFCYIGYNNWFNNEKKLGLWSILL